MNYKKHVEIKSKDDLEKLDIVIINGVKCRKLEDDIFYNISYPFDLPIYIENPTYDMSMFDGPVIPINEDMPVL